MEHSDVSGKHHVNIDTGDVMRFVPVGDKERRYAYPGGYITMGITNISRLVKADLPINGLKLALLIAGKCQSWTGLVQCSNQEYAEELGISANRVCRLIHSLAKAGFIHRAGDRLVIVNPGWCFRGTPEQHHAAIEQWCKLHPLKAVGKEEAA